MFSRLIENEQPQTFSSEFGWTQYYNLDEIYGFLDQLVDKYPNVVTPFTYGKSYEGRDLRAVKISHKQVWPIVNTIFINLERSRITMTKWKLSNLFLGKTNHFH